MNATPTRPRLPLVLAALGLFAFTPAAAQEEPEPDRSVTVISVDEDGVVTINGEPIEGDGRVVIRVERDGEGVRVLDGAVRVFDDFDVDVPNFTVRVPDPEMMERMQREAESLRREAESLRPLRRYRLDGALDPEGPVVFFRSESAEVARLEREARELARDVRQAEGAERERLRTELADKLDEVFEAKLEHRRERLERLREQLNEEQAGLEQRQDLRDAIIDRRLRDLLGEEDELDW